MKHKKYIFSFKTCSAVAYTISAIMFLMKMQDYAIYTLLSAIHMNMLSWEDKDDQ